MEGEIKRDVWHSINFGPMWSPISHNLFTIHYATFHSQQMILFQDTK